MRKKLAHVARLFAFIALLVLPGNGACEVVNLVTGEWPPFVSAHLPGHGFFTEIVVEAFKAVGLEARYEFYPWKRCEKLVSEGKAYAAFPYVKTDERGKVCNFSDNIYTGRNVLFYVVRDDYKFQYEGIGSLKGLSIAGQLGNFYESQLKDAGVSYHYTMSVVAAFQMLLSKRVDFVLENDLVGWATLREYLPEETGKIGVCAKPFAMTESCLLVSRSYPDADLITAKFNEGLRIIRENGVMDGIFRKHGVEH